MSDLLTTIQEELAKSCKGVNLQPMGDDKFYTERSSLDTGSYALNFLMSGSPYIGLYAGQILSLEGESYTGKSLSASHLLASAVKAGAFCILADTEGAYQIPAMMAMGADPMKIFLLRTRNIEAFFMSTFKIIQKIRETDAELPIFVLVDSLSMLQTSHLEEVGLDKADMGRAKVIKAGYMYINNLIIDSSTWFVSVNHIYDQIASGVPLPKEQQQKVSGGKMAEYGPGTRLRFGHAKKLLSNPDVYTSEAIGAWIRCESIKNRFNLPYAKTELITIFGQGYDRYSGLFGLYMHRGLIKTTTKGYYNFVEQPLPSHFREKQFSDIIKGDSRHLERLVAKHAAVDTTNFELGDDRDKSTKSDAEALIQP